jgi:hypothetical protein
MAEELIYDNFKVGNGDEVKILLGSTPKEEWVLHEKALRNSKLAESDSMLVSDRGLSESKLTEWKTYRQALRDFDFSSYEIGDEITWPTKPE